MSKYHWQEDYYEMITEAAEAARQLGHRMGAGAIPMEPFYLYYKAANEQTGLWGELRLFPESQSPTTSEWGLATGEPLRLNVPYDKYWTWIRENSRRLPIIGMMSRAHHEPRKGAKP